MRLKLNKIWFFALIAIFCAIQWELVASYRTEVEITPAPPEEEATTKKSGFFGGIKNFFRSSPTTTTTELPIQGIGNAPPARDSPPQRPSLTGNMNPSTTAATGGSKPPPLNVHQAPLVPLGPRPETPSSPLAGNQQQPPMWPQPQPMPNVPNMQSPSPTPTRQQPQSQWAFPSQSTTTTTARPQFQNPRNPTNSGTPFGAGTAQQVNAGTPNMLPGFGSYQTPRPLPSGLDLSYGGGAQYPGRPQSGSGYRGSSLAPMVPATSTSTTTPTPPRSAQPPQPMIFDVRGGSTTTARSQPNENDFPALPTPRRPSAGSKEDFPVLPTPRSPSPTPASPVRPSSPSAWNVPLSTPSSAPGAPTPASPMHPGSSAAAGGGNRVSFVPHASTTTTVRPGVPASGNSLATDDEIRALTEILYTKETNSQLDAIRVNPQGKTRSIDSEDAAPQPLLEVDEKALESPTIAKMRVLFNNYEVDTLANEHVTPNERKEENDFVDAVMATSVMHQAMLFLQNKGLVTADPKTHRDLVKELWFTQYSRGSGKIGSSGFEHVFVNEVKNGTLIGLHNWVYFYDEEKANRLDYKGYLNQMDLGTKGKVLKVRFTHNGLNKPVNTLFVGTSPELEMALYTVCFELRPDRTCPVSLGNNKFGIVTYSWRYRGKNLIGSAYPEI